MSWFIDKKTGSLSGFRVAIAIAVFGAIFLVGGYIIFNLELRNAQQPLNIDVPDATELIAVDESNMASGQRIVFYQSTLAADAIAAFYDQKLADFQNTTVQNLMRERCHRQPRDGNDRAYVAGNGSLPFFWQCLFDNSTTYEQSTMIRIYPGQRNDATGENFEGVTRIDYEQFWQP